MEGDGSRRGLWAERPRVRAKSSREPSAPCEEHGIPTRGQQQGASRNLLKLIRASDDARSGLSLTITNRVEAAHSLQWRCRPVQNPPDLTNSRFSLLLSHCLKQIRSATNSPLPNLV